MKIYIQMKSVLYKNAISIICNLHTGHLLIRSYTNQYQLYAICPPGKLNCKDMPRVQYFMNRYIQNSLYYSTFILKKGNFLFLCTSWFHWEVPGSCSVESFLLDLQTVHIYWKYPLGLASYGKDQNYYPCSANNADNDVCNFYWNLQGILNRKTNSDKFCINCRFLRNRSIQNVLRCMHSENPNPDAVLHMMVSWFEITRTETVRSDRLRLKGKQLKDAVMLGPFWKYILSLFLVIFWFNENM